MIDFSQFKSTWNETEFMQSVKEQEEKLKGVPNGTYTAVIDEMGLMLSKTNKLMFKVIFKIIEGTYNNKKVHMYRVISGTKNDPGMIQGVITFLDDLACDVATAFQDYSNVYEELEEMIELIEEEAKQYEYTITYDKDAFNTISIADDDE